MIEIYGKHNCPFCDKAKFLCERNNLEYVYKQLDEDFDRVPHSIDDFFNVFIASEENILCFGVSRFDVSFGDF